MNEKFPFSIQDVDPALVADFHKFYKCKQSSLVQVGPKKITVDANFRHYADIYYNFEMRSDDVFITGFPRSGTTVLQEMVWMLINNFDFEKARSMRTHERVPLLEANCRDTDETFERLKNSGNSELRDFIEIFRTPLKILTEYTGRRVVKTHLPLNFMANLLKDNNRKVIYVARNPKDVIVSLYKFQVTSPPSLYDGPFSMYYEYFKKGFINFTPYWDHVEQGYQVRNLPNIKFIFYEDVVKNLGQSLKEIADFLNVKLTDTNFYMMQEHLKIDNFKNYMNAEVTVNDLALIRKGEVGEWKNYFFAHSDLLKDVDEWIAENSKKVGIQYP